MADLDRPRAGGGLVAGHEEAGAGVAEGLDGGTDGLLGFGVGDARAGVLAAFAGRDEADEQAAGGCLLGLAEAVVDVVGTFGDRTVDAAGLAVGVEGEAAGLALLPGFLQRVFEEGELAEIVGDLAQKLVHQRLVDGEAHRFGRLADGGFEVGPFHRAEIDHGLDQRRVLEEVAVEVGAGGEDDGAGAGAGSVEEEADEALDIGRGLLRVGRVAQGLGVELLPLVDIEEEAVGALLPAGRRGGRGCGGRRARPLPRSTSTCRLTRVVGLERGQVQLAAMKVRTRVCSGSGPGRRLRTAQVRPSARRRRAGIRPA